MPRKKRSPWGEGDIFAIPLKDGTFATGQVLRTVPEPLPAAICALFDATLVSVDDARDADLSFEEENIISVLFVTSEALSGGEWPVVGRRSPFPADRFLDVEGMEAARFLGVEMQGSAAAEKLMNAFHALTPWDDFYRPDYLDNLLVSPDKKPKNVVLKRN